MQDSEEPLEGHTHIPVEPPHQNLAISWAQRREEKRAPLPLGCPASGDALVMWEQRTLLKSPSQSHRGCHELPEKQRVLGPRGACRWGPNHTETHKRPWQRDNSSNPNERTSQFLNSEEGTEFHSMGPWLSSLLPRSQDSARPLRVITVDGSWYTEKQMVSNSGAL